MKAIAGVAAALLVVILTSAEPVLAQDAVPTEILARTLFIKWGNEMGTAFTFDYQGRLYLVTARHVVAGVPAVDAVIQIRQGDQWKDYWTVRTIYPSSPDVDVAIFETSEKAPAQGYIIEPSNSNSGVTFGQQVWFIGYPFGLESKFMGGKTFAFLKRGTMSAIDASNPDAIVLYIDGFNNPGFSGGPIIYWNFTTHKYELMGVVKGYREEATQQDINGQLVDTQILQNSGILIAYSIKHVTDAIKESLRPKH